MISERIIEQRRGNGKSRSYHDDELAALRDRVEELEALLGLQTFHATSLKLRPSEEALLSLLLKGALVVPSRALIVIYGGLPEADQPDLKIIDVWLCKLRRKLRPFGITIKNDWGRGYYMDAANRTLTLSVLESCRI